MTSITYRPLTGWPWPITGDRGYSRFRVGYDATKRELAAEIRYHSGGDDIIIELDVADRDVRRDKQLRVGTKVRSPRSSSRFRILIMGGCATTPTLFASGERTCDVSV